MAMVPSDSEGSFEEIPLAPTGKVEEVPVEAVSPEVAKEEEDTKSGNGAENGKKTEAKPKPKEAQEDAEAGDKAPDESVSYLQFSMNDPVEYRDTSSGKWLAATFLGSDAGMAFVETNHDVSRGEILTLATSSLRFPSEDKPSGKGGAQGKEERKSPVVTARVHRNEMSDDDEDEKGPTKGLFLDEEEEKRPIRSAITAGKGKVSVWRPGDKDEWEDVNDFVFSEYIRDVAHLVPDLLQNLDVFVKHMEILGVQSEVSRSRALGILEDLRNELQTQKYMEEFEANMTEEEKQLQRRMLMRGGGKQDGDKKAGGDKSDWGVFGRKSFVAPLEMGDPQDKQCIRCEEIENVPWNIYHLRQCMHAYCIFCFTKDIKKWIRTAAQEIKEFRRKKRKYPRKYRGKHLDVEIPCCDRCKTPLLLEDVDLFLNDSTLLSQMKKLLEFRIESDNDSDDDRRRKKKRKKKRKGHRYDSDSDSSRSSDSSDSSSGSSDSDDSSDSSRESVGDGFYHCLAEDCEGKVEKSRRRKRKFKCPECKAKNCLRCKTIHEKRETCESYQLLHNHWFLRRWGDGKLEKYKARLKKLEKKRRRYKKKGKTFRQSDEEEEERLAEKIHKLKKKRKHRPEDGPLLSRFDKRTCESIEVKRGSKEWRKVVSHIQDGRQVNRIERVQNRRLWKAYQRYCKNLVEKRRLHLDEKWVWHGTRTTPPENLWRGSGFDLTYARVGGCLWYAMQNSYSMGGYQYPNPRTGENQVFLACVQCADMNDVKVIRGSILNVYRNEATYPAYVVSYF